MAIRQSGDSLSRCDPGLYGGLYDVSKPKAAIKEIAKPQKPTDTLEISGTKLKKEALERLRHTSKYLVIQNVFMRIGRVLFIAVAFPPYMLVYGLPKWILVQALPMVASIMVPLAEKMQKQAKKMTHVIKQRMVQVLRFMQRLGVPLVQPLVKTWRAFQNSVKRLRYQVQMAFNQAGEKLKDTFTALIGFAPKHFKRLKNIPSQILERVSQLKNKMEATFQSIKQTPQNVIQWLSTHFRQLPDYLLRWPRKWKMNFQSSQQVANKTTEWLSKQFQSLKKPLQELVQPVKQLYAALKPAFNKLLVKCDDFLKRARDNLDQRKKRFLNFLKQVEEKIRLTSLKHLYDKILSTLNRFGFSELWQKTIAQFLNNFLVKAWVNACFKGTSFLSILVLKMTTVVASGLFDTGRYILASLGWVINYPMKASERGVSYVSATGRLIGQFFRKMTYTVLLMVVMVSITLFWGMRSAKRGLDRLVA